jgi:hypothetical protein
MKTLGEVQKAVHVAKDKRNDFGGYNYRTAEGILSAVKAVLPEDAHIMCYDEISEVAGQIFVTATAELKIDGKSYLATGSAMHALTKKGMDAAQITGACSSYARKYALAGLFALDDGSVDPDATNKHDSEPEQPKTAAGNAWLDNILDGLPADATARQKAEAIASAMIERINDYKTVKPLDTFIDRNKKLMDSLYEKHNDLYGYVRDALDQKRDDLSGG